jgi:hypothetical protein
MIITTFFMMFACAPTCEQTCKKILTCEELSSPGMNLDECTSACSAQQNVYEAWDDPDKENAFDDLKSCIVAEECESVTEGVCYDEDMYIW